LHDTHHPDLVRPVNTAAGSMNTTITFPRPTKALLSMNDRKHWRPRAIAVHTWRAYASAHGQALRSKGYPPSMVCVTLDVPDKRRRDPANFFPCVKAIVDGLVDAGLWPDDTPEWVTVVEPVLRVVKGPLMVEVTLRPR
jgi:crossover junction endodeoxyribonuclease RusA